jgi:hypothetical protein
MPQTLRADKRAAVIIILVFTAIQIAECQLPFKFLIRIRVCSCLIEWKWGEIQFRAWETTMVLQLLLSRCADSALCRILWDHIVE